MANLADKLSKQERKRVGFWSESIAVGDEDWLQSESGRMGMKRQKIVIHGDTHYIVGR